MSSRRMATTLARKTVMASPLGRSAVAGPSRLVSSSATRLQSAPSTQSETSQESMPVHASPTPSSSSSLSNTGRAASARTQGATPSAYSENVPQTHTQPSVLDDTKVLPRTHGHHIATLHLRSYGLPIQKANLDFFSDFAMRVGYALGIPLSRPAALPTRMSLWTVLRSPFVHKKAQENFERKTHKRVIKAFDADPQVVERWLQFLRIHAMAGVGMRVETYRKLPLGIGAQMLEASTSALRSVPHASNGQETDGATATPQTVRSSEASGDAVARLAEEFVRGELAAYEKEAEAAGTDRDTPAVAQEQEQEQEVAMQQEEKQAQDVQSQKQADPAADNATTEPKSS